MLDNLLHHGDREVPFDAYALRGTQACLSGRIRQIGIFKQGEEFLYRPFPCCPQGCVRPALVVACDLPAFLLAYLESRHALCPGSALAVVCSTNPLQEFRLSFRS
jgi:hypothetical protein